jgi:hypothetical protein
LESVVDASSSSRNPLRPTRQDWALKCFSRLLLPLEHSWWYAFKLIQSKGHEVGDCHRGKKAEDQCLSKNILKYLKCLSMLIIILPYFATKIAKDWRCHTLFILGQQVKLPLKTSRNLKKRRPSAGSSEVFWPDAAHWREAWHGTSGDQMDSPL